MTNAFTSCTRWQKFCDCLLIVLFFHTGWNPPEDIIGVNTYPVHSLASSHLSHIMLYIFYTPFLSTQAKHNLKPQLELKYLFCYILLLLSLLWFWNVSLKVFFSCLHPKLFIHWASVNEKKRSFIALKLSFRNPCSVRVMDFPFVSDLFVWLHYISHSILWCRVKVQHRQASSLSK